TWYINKNTNRIEGEADGALAVRQAVEIILNIERFLYQIYRPYTGVELGGLIGQDAGYAAQKLKRRLDEALTADDRINRISGFSYQIEGAVLSVSLTVDTVYGEAAAQAEVILA